MALGLRDYALGQIHCDRVIKRQIDELIALANVALPEAKLDQAGAERILAWFGANTRRADAWAPSALYDRLRTLGDGIPGREERNDLASFVTRIAASDSPRGNVEPDPVPLTVPAPPIVHYGRRFCFTGVFEFGSRCKCHGLVLALGGEPTQVVSPQLDYLVVGAIGSGFWRHASFGSKIMQAAQYRRDGSEIAIVSESYWLSRLS